MYHAKTLLPKVLSAAGTRGEREMVGYAIALNGRVLFPIVSSATHHLALAKDQSTSD